MSMNFTITDIQLISFQNGYAHVYLKVTASDLGWNFTEEFHIGRQVVGSQVVTNAQGWPKRIDGVFIDPASIDPDQPEPIWAREPVVADLRAEIRNVVAKTMKGKLLRQAKQDSPEMLKKVILSRIGTWDDATKLPLLVRQMVGRTETV